MRWCRGTPASERSTHIGGFFHNAYHRKPEHIPGVKREPGVPLHALPSQPRQSAHPYAATEPAPTRDMAAHECAVEAARAAPTATSATTTTATSAPLPEAGELRRLSSAQALAREQARQQRFDAALAGLSRPAQDFASP